MIFLLSSFPSVLPFWHPIRLRINRKNESRKRLKYSLLFVNWWFFDNGNGHLGNALYRNAGLLPASIDRLQFTHCDCLLACRSHCIWYRLLQLASRFCTQVLIVNPRYSHGIWHGKYTLYWHGCDASTCRNVP